MEKYFSMDLLALSIKGRHLSPEVNSMGFEIKKIQVQIKLPNILEPQCLYLLNGNNTYTGGLLLLFFSY